MPTSVLPDWRTRKNAELPASEQKSGPLCSESRVREVLRLRGLDTTARIYPCMALSTSTNRRDAH